MLEQLSLLENTQPQTIILYLFQRDVIGYIYRAIVNGKKSITLGAATGSGSVILDWMPRSFPGQEVAL